MIKENTMEEQILIAAKELFLQNGYDGVSTTLVAKKVGCNQALVHYYYRTKQNLFKIVFLQEIKRVTSRLNDIPQGDISFEDFVSRIIDTQIEFLQDNINIPFLIIGELRNNSEAIELIQSSYVEVFKEVRGKVQTFLDAKRENGELGEVVAERLFLDILSLNVFPFMIQTFFSKIWGMDQEEQKLFLAKRKEHIKKVIIASVKA
ncbi:MAG: TetR/AcrR family transcriptional regulator [Bacteroidales bacterium]|nr:TetR/AcrR family transcriptional regulator [Bacteroidales bacterium]